MLYRSTQTIEKPTEAGLVGGGSNIAKNYVVITFPEGERKTVATKAEDLGVPIREFAERIAAKNYIEIKPNAIFRGPDSKPLSGTVDDYLGQTISISSADGETSEKPVEETYTTISLLGGVYNIDKKKSSSDSPPTTALQSSKSSGSIPNLNQPVVTIQVQPPSKKDKEHDKAKAKADKEEGRKEKNRKSESPMDKKTKK